MGIIYTINGQPLHVQEEGVLGRPIAILIHGWSSSWFAVSPLVNILKQRYRCLAVDLPGFGQSPASRERLTIPLYTELIIGLIEQVSPSKPVVLVGHSMGGMISLTLALRRPELIERMVLVCPTVSGHLAPLINMMLFPFVVMERFSFTRAIVTIFEPLIGITDRLLRTPLFADRTEISQADYERIKADSRRRDQGSVRAEAFRAMRENDLRGQLGKIHVPSLIVWGMEDNVVPLRDASVVAREMPEADLRIIPNAGHWPQFETPQITERHVRAFMSTPLKLLRFEM